MRFLKLMITISIIFAGLFGDYVVFRSKYSESQLFRAAADSIVHATIGLLSAVLFFTNSLNIPLQTCIYYTILCTVVSSLIDIDHVFVAKSIRLKDLTNLNQRGIFHCTTFWLVVTTILLVYSYTVKKLNTCILTYMLILAFTSHHLRDANRRGLWLYPFGHTAAINKYVYVILSAVLPYVFAYAYVCTKQLMNVKHYYSHLIETV
ncbi:Uncharacterized protein OBRU01_16075 [Operophtera brumata]|uniref:Transmembrane protein 267 n=1 Tax=Operophtera brumata TaxID=104452 RepID=A0A0L7L3U0_OPEBR|nr:Uncharacterized protein OBRU01_16075 [Operophtera brumata]